MLFTTWKKEKETEKNSSWKLREVKNLNLIGMSSENKKNANLWHHRGASFIRLNELGRLSN